MRYLQGHYTQTTLANELGVTINAVQKWCKRARVKRPKPNRTFDTQSIRELAYFHLYYYYLQRRQLSYVEDMHEHGGFKNYVKEQWGIDFIELVIQYLNSEGKQMVWVQILIEELSEYYSR